MPEPSRWHIANISAIGMSVRRHTTAEKNIRIGGLLGFKTKSEQHWSVGLVRWAACGSRDRLEIGAHKVHSLKSIKQATKRWYYCCLNSLR